MAQTSFGTFQASFKYKKKDLDDFENFYSQKKAISPKLRVVLGVLGIIGVLFFGYTLYKDGFTIASTGYLIAFSLMLLIAFHTESKGQDDTVGKYRKHYTGKQVDMTISEKGVEMHLEKQKQFSKTKLKKIYGLYKTDQNYYLSTSGKGYYILPKDALEGGTQEEFEKYLEKQCRKHFIKS